MPANYLDVFGTVGPDGTLALDQKLSVPPGRVKVRVEVIGATSSPGENMLDFVDRVRSELEAAGHRFRTKEEIDSEMEVLRNEWDGPIQPSDPETSAC